MEDEEKMVDWSEHWQMELLEKSYHRKELKKLLSSDPVLKILEAQITGSLRIPTSTRVLPLDQLDAIRSLMKLPYEAEYTAGFLCADAIGM